jgi:RNA polymerase sigma-70 factor, ECF subfamily
VIAGATTADKALAVAQEDNNLLESVVHEHTRMVYRIAYSVLRTPADAEDTVQETFLRVLRHGKKAAQVQDRKAWLARIAWRVATERRGKLDRSAARHEEPAEILPSPADGADRVLLEKERSEILQQFIAALPDRRAKSERCSA